MVMFIFGRTSSIEFLKCIANILERYDGVVNHTHKRKFAEYDEEGPSTPMLL